MIYDFPDFIEEAVGGLCPFEEDVGTVLLMEAEETLVQFAALVLQNADLDIDACFAEHGDTFAGDQRVRVEHADDNAPYAFFDDQFGTRGRLAVMGAGFEAHEEGAVLEIGYW